MSASGSTSTRPVPRRPVQACASCKKSKVRCEIIELYDLEQDVKCHRCTVVRHPCTFSSMDKSLFAAYVSKPEAAETSAKSPSPFAQALIQNEDSSVKLSVGYGSAEIPKPTGNVDDRIPESIPLPGLSQSHFELEWKEPLSAIQQLIQPKGESTASPANLPSTPDLSLDAILSREQADELLEIFAMCYVPWLNFPLMRDSTGAVLEMVCCTVASRHLSPHFRSLVSARLQRLTNDTIAKFIFNSSGSQSLETVQGLLILAFWPPVSSSDSGVRDGRVLIASAVSIAMNMGLNEASAKAMQMQRSDAPEAQIAELKNKARLWLALTNAESMLCLGTRGMPLASRSSSDINFIPSAALCPENLIECRDARLRYLGEIFNAVEASNKLELLDQCDLEKWYDDVMRSLGTMDAHRRSILPLEVLADHDRFYFRMLTVQLHSCRLQVLHRAMFNVLSVFPQPDPNNTFWFIEVKPHGVSVMVTWGKEALHLAEQVLITVLDTDPRDLSSCPDTIFYMVTYAAYRVYTTMCSILRHFRTPLGGTVSKLFRRTMEHLATSAPSEDHLASACSRLISVMSSTLNNFESADVDVVQNRFPSGSNTQARNQQPPAQLPQPSEINQQIPLQDVDIEFWTQFFGYDPSDSLQSHFI